MTEWPALAKDVTEPGVYVIEYYWRHHEPGSVMADFDGTKWRFHYAPNKWIELDQIHLVVRKLSDL